MTYPTGNVDRVVGDPLDLGTELDGDDDKAKIGGGGLVFGDELGGETIDFHLVLVDLVIHGDHAICELGVTHRQGPGNIHQPLLHHPGHGEDRSFYLVEFDFELALHPSLLDDSALDDPRTVFV